MKGKILKAAVAGILCAAMSLSSVQGIVTVAEDTDGIIYSSDFEDGDTSKFSKRGDRDTSVIEVSDDASAPSGSKVMSVTGRSSGWNGPSFDCSSNLEPNVKYVVSAKVKAAWYNNVRISIQQTPAGATEATYGNLVQAVSQGDWVELTTSFSFPDSSKDVSVYIESDDKTDLWVDDFSISLAPNNLDKSLPSLKNVYSKYFKLGTATTAQELAPKSTKELILKHFNSITAGNELKPDAVLDKNACLALAEEGDDTNPQVSLASARSILDFARDNNIPVRGHVLVWHQQTPTWFFKENYADDGEWVSKEKMLQRMENYIKNVFEAVKEEYPDVDFYAWDVVNECWLDDGNYRKAGSQEEGSQNSPWVKVFGDNSFIKPAFEFAKKYAPEGTKLYYNDFNEYMPQKTQAIIKMVEEINSDGHYIDGIGMQSHLDVRSGSDAFPAVNVYEKAVKAFTETGLDVQVTELDATVNDTDHFAEQAQYYSDIMDVLVKYADKISAVVFWGTTDDQSWRASKTPLLFNEDYSAKESFHAIIDGLDYDEEIPQVVETEVTFTDKIKAISAEDMDSEWVEFEEHGSYETKNLSDFISAGVGSTVKVTLKILDNRKYISEVSSIEVVEDTVSDVVYGDANLDGKVSISDSVAILQYVANASKYNLDDKAKANADVDGDPGVTGKDAAVIQSVDAGVYDVSQLPLKS